jgi:hypothetical protein
MIVLGPRDADLGGAPAYWREANWRPDTLGRQPSGAAFPSIPFDRCDLVLEYDARRPEQPLPSDQGWKLQSESDGIWRHDPLHGVLRFQPEGATPSFWRQVGELPDKFDRAAAHGLFSVSRSAAGLDDGGLNFRFAATPDGGRGRGMRGTWSSSWHWRALDGSEIFQILKAAAEPGIERVWHGFGMDAELTGPQIDAADTDSDDGGKTIGSLDGLVSNEDRRRFRYGLAEPGFVAEFGLTEANTRMEGMVLYFAASLPGRFLRPAFRATALAETTRLRLLFARGQVSEDDRAAAMLVRYASAGIGPGENALPVKEPPVEFVKFDPALPDALSEIAYRLEDLVPDEPIRFTVERDWRNPDDTLPETVHLVSLILEEAG